MDTKNPPDFSADSFKLAGTAVRACIVTLPAAAALSDRRAKTDIRRIGTSDAGLPIYAYRFKTGGPVQVGMMADEVEKVFPDAVVTIGGLQHVDYSRVG